MTFEHALKEQWRLRPARAEDAATIADLIVLTGDSRPEFSPASEQQSEPTTDELARSARAHARAFAVTHSILAEYAGQPAGVMLGYRISRKLEALRQSRLPSHLRPIANVAATCPGSYYINTLAVFPQFQGLGLGSILIEKAALAEATRLHCLSLTLEVDLDNSHALNFYKRHGFHSVVEDENVFDACCPDDKNIVLMQRLIPYSWASRRLEESSEWRIPLSTWR